MKTFKDTLETGRFEISYRVYGDHDDVLVCVSGAMQTMSIWRSLVKHFTDHYTVVVFDMPGVGRSRIKSGSAHVVVEEQLESLHALVERTHTRGGSLAMAASSWGTAIAAFYAATRPDKVQRLLLSSFGMQPNAGMEYLLERATKLYAEGNFAGGGDLILEVFGANLKPAYKAQIAAQFRQLNAESAEVFYEHCANILKLGRLQDVVDLSAIKAQTLIINGADDPIIDLNDMYVAERLIPHCELRLVEGVGHFLHFEKPELLDEYARFLLAEEETTD